MNIDKSVLTRTDCYKLFYASRCYVCDKEFGKLINDDLLDNLTDSICPKESISKMEWYSIFSSYYWQILSQRDEVPNDLQAEVIQSLSWPDKYLSLIVESITELLNISITYPLHVVIVAYEEDLLRMRDKYLVKIVTPIYCLYHKLRNVQYDK